MFDLLMRQLTELTMQSLHELYWVTFYYATLMSFLSGCILPTLYFDKPDKHEKGSLLRRLMIVLGVLLFCFGTLANFTVPWLVESVQRYAYHTVTPITYSSAAYFFIPLFVVGLILHIAVRRELTPILNKWTKTLTKETDIARDTRTDVRTVKALLPETKMYDPEQYIDLNKGVFVGLDTEHQPQYIPLKDLQKQHADIIGTTGAGKGVATGLILSQLIAAEEGVFVLDPKNDEFAPHLMRKACEKAGKPFYLIDLNKNAPQLDLLAGTTPEQIEELLVAGFSFAEKGDIADFYRIDDRKAARVAPTLATEDERASFETLFQSAYVQGLKETVKAFYGKLEELSLVTSVNAIDGMKLKDVFDSGGCCYIIGSLRNAKILMTQKMILIRLFQLAEMRDRVAQTPRPIAIFLDELKYHISKPAMEGLGAARDKGVHMFLAHQSIADLRDCPADLNGDSVVGAVVENTKFKLVYRLQDPDTAKWVAEMSGIILVDDETRYVETDKSLTEVVDNKRNIRMAERQFVDTNMLLNLPSFVSYIFTTNDVPKPSLIAPIKVEKKALVTFDEVENVSSIDASINSSELFNEMTEEEEVSPFSAMATPNSEPVRQEGEHVDTPSEVKEEAPVSDEVSPLGALESPEKTFSQEQDATQLESAQRLNEESEEEKNNEEANPLNAMESVVESEQSAQEATLTEPDSTSSLSPGEAEKESASDISESQVPLSEESLKLIAEFQQQSNQLLGEKRDEATQ